MQTGTTLIADIDSADVPQSNVALWWLGQHSFILKMAGRILYVDPFLSPHPGRLIPALVTPKQLEHADVVLGTHDHGDHIDREVWPEIAAASQATFVVPDLVRESIVDELGISEDRVVGLDHATTVDVDGLKITGIAAAHEFLDRDEESGRYPFLGYMIEAGGCKVYHAGDTVKYEGLEERVKQHVPIDVAMLPINGRDAQRLAGGIVGNMTYQEAVDLAGAIEPGLTIPTHYDMTPGNLEDPKLFVDYLNVKYPGLVAKICRYGERVQIGKDH